MKHVRHGFGAVRPYIHGPLELLTFVDEAFARALARDAEIVLPITDQEYEERSGGVKDMAGNTWWISSYRPA